MQTNYDSRREYIRKIKESFTKGEPLEYKNRGGGEHGFEQEDEKGEIPRSFWKLRILLAVLCFIGFFMIHQTDWHWKGISEKTIVTQIRKNYDLETVKDCFQEITDYFK